MTLLQKCIKILARVPNTIAIGGIHCYRAILSPSEGILRFLSLYPRPSCIFYPTCSEYGIQCFQQYSFLVACTKTFKRISRCHSGNTPSVDLV